MFHFFTSEKTQSQKCFIFLLRIKPKVRSISLFYFGKNPKSEVLHFFTSDKTQSQKCFTFLLWKKLKVRSVSFFYFGKIPKSEVVDFFTSDNVSLQWVGNVWVLSSIRRRVSFLGRLSTLFYLIYLKYRILKQQLCCFFLLNHAFSLNTGAF